MKNVLSILIIGLIIVGCSREENNERKALSQPYNYLFPFRYMPLTFLFSFLHLFRHYTA
jgi:hypothetical protein